MVASFNFRYHNYLRFGLWMEGHVLSTKETQRHEGQLYRQKLIALLSGDLNFHDRSSREVTHDLQNTGFSPRKPRRFNGSG